MKLSGQVFDQLRDRKKSFRNFFLFLRPKPFYSPGPQESIALWSDTKFERLSPFRSFFRFSTQWDYIWTKIEKKLRKGLFRSNFVSDLGAIDSCGHGE